MRWAALPAKESQALAPATGDEGPAVADAPFAVPKGTPEELLKYIEGLKQRRPTSDSKEATGKFRKELATALLAASDRILAAQPQPDQAKAAVRYKMVALELLERSGDADASRKLEALPAELEKAGLKDLVREVRTQLLQGRVLRAGVEKPEALGPLLAEVKSFLGQAPPDDAAADLAIQAALAAEYHGPRQQAIDAYTDFSALLAKGEGKTIALKAAKMQGAARRLGLVGKPMGLEGTTLAGKPFDWAKCRGKVVLVNFFATWCLPAREEIPNIVKLYETYRDRGFDVVAVSLDEDREAVEKFLEEHKQPWTTILDHPEGIGAEKAMSTRYGVFSIPETVLVAKDGNVASLGLRGPALGKELEKLLGPAAK
jgi:thiol-disulfide isomerase/thioredoxin